MRVTGNLILDGSPVTLVDIDVNGLEIYATYITSTGSMQTTRFNYNPTINGTPIMTGAVSYA